MFLNNNSSQKQNRSLARNLLLATTTLIALSFLFFYITSPPSGGPGYILDGSNSILNPDGGDYMSSVSGDGSWTITTNEFAQFEQLAGSGGLNQAWAPISDVALEPTGMEVSADLGSGGSCGNTDITVDSDGGSDYAYYTIIDPDINVVGDEVLGLAMRLADEVTGNFSFSFLVDALNDCGSDANSVCGNPCFEYEIQVISNGNKVNVINIDGCAGTADCDALNGGGGDAYVCEPCNTGALQVVAGSGACTTSNLDPVFWMAHVPFSQLAGVDPMGNFKLVPATTTSPNSVIYKNTNVSDYGGIGDPADTDGCDCATECAGSSCADCIRDCALSCAATPENPNFPVAFISFEGIGSEEQVALSWITAMEINNHYFEIERQTESAGFAFLGRVEGSGNSSQPTAYSFVDLNPKGSKAVYRLRQVDFNGAVSYSPSVEIALESKGFDYGLTYRASSSEITLLVYGNEARQEVEFSLLTLSGSPILKETLILPQGEGNQNIRVGDLASGLYVVMVSSSDGRDLGSKKIVIP